jgi:hypothetical protein
VECSGLSAVSVEGILWAVGLNEGVKDCVRI